VSHRTILLSFAALQMTASAPAQQFDLRDVSAPEKAAQTSAASGALDTFLFEGFYRNPVGNFTRTDVWEEDTPVSVDEGRLKVATSLITAARSEDEARALSSVLAAYRDGADKALPPAPAPAVTFGSNAAPAGETAAPVRRRDPATNNKDIPTDRRGLPLANKQNAAETNGRLGARIVSNLATFRSCSGALVAYLNHLSDDDAKAASWARMIRRSLGVAALPPDYSCLPD
jgi:hypothetical protein